MTDACSSMHIIGSRQFGGADQFYVRLLQALAESGQTVTAVNRAGSPVSQALEELAIQQFHLPLANGWDLWSVWKLRQLISAKRPDIVQTYMGRATRLTRLPHRSPAIHIARLGGFYKIDGYYRHAHAWIGNTKSLCDYLVKSGLPSERVYQIGNFVPDAQTVSADELGALRHEWQIAENAWVVFALGRLLKMKGFDDLLEALARLPSSVAGRPLVLMIAGDGPELDALKTLTRQLGLDSKVRWLGWQNPPDRFYALADVFVCPSRLETLGNVILEAWNYRLPVISTRSEGGSELIDNRHSGLLCECDDPQGLADLLLELLSANEADRAALGEAGHRELQLKHGKASVVKAYTSLYRQLMDTRPA
jgi:glycosyltransferase involved in cell wall biosynthesis